MPRRKTYLSDDSSDSNASEEELEDDDYADEDPDARAERQLFQGVKRRKKGNDTGDGKESAWMGIFGSEDENNRGGIGGGRGRGSGSSRGRGAEIGTRSGSKRFTAPSFVSASDKVTPEDFNPNDPKHPVEEEQERKQYTDKPRDGIDDEDDEDDEMPRLGGIGMERSKGGGIGSSSASTSFVKAPLAPKSFLASFEKGVSTPKEGSPAADSTSEPDRETSNPSKVNRYSTDITTDPEMSGIGTSARHRIEEEQTEVVNEVPTAFGGRKQGRNDGFAPPPRPSASVERATTSTSTPNGRSFLHGGSSSTSSRPQKSFMGRPTEESRKGHTPDPTVTAADIRHLQSISSSFGARMLAKQGWTVGKGLGKDESGKAVPIQANIGLQRGQGLGKGVRTEQSKREAKARGEKFSSDEEEESRRDRRRQKKKGGRQDGNEEDEDGILKKGENASWKKQRKIKVKVEHKTYDELLAEAGTESSAPGMGLVLDARSGELKEVADIANLSLSTWTPTSDKTQLPELRHNLRLILDSTKADVQALAKEGKGVNEKRNFAKREVEKMRRQAQEDEIKITNMETILLTIESVKSKIQTTDTKIQQEQPLADLADDFKTLIEDYRLEYDEYDLDDVVVGAIAHVLAPVFREWQPLDPSSQLLNYLLPWKKAFRYSASQSMDLSRAEDAAGSNVMTPFEALINTLWLPKVRSALNNDWDPHQAEPAVDLIKSWTPILPRFVLDNVLDQLVLPKIKNKIKEWNPRRGSQSLASVVFPWLPVLDDRADEMLEDAKLQVGDAMKRWSTKDVIPKDLPLWRDIFSRGKWDTLILINILPKLATYLDSHFEVNPRQQNMAPLDAILNWSSLMRESTFMTLLEEKFFPKWLDTLHFWLIQPNYNAAEVASWYHFWKDHLNKFLTTHKTRLSESKGVEHGFRYGLKLMNEAVTLGDAAPSRLAKPDFKPIPSRRSKESSSSRTVKPSPAPHVDENEISFKTIAEEHAAEHNLIFVPTGKSHPGTGKPLFKVSKNVDGRGGVTVYVGEDAVYAMMDDGRYRAVLLDDMVKMAGGGQ